MFPSGLNPISSLGVSKAGYPAPERQTRAKSSQEANCDSLRISSHGEQKTPFLDLVSSLSKEVRTATSTKDIRSLKEQIAAGTYQIDADKIAAGMLFFQGN